MIRLVIPSILRAMLFPKPQNTILVIAILGCAFIFLGQTGCGTWKHQSQYQADVDKYVGLAERVAFSDVIKDVDGPGYDHSAENIPATVDEKARQPFPLSIEMAVQNALTNSKILRDLGARLVRAPDSARSIMDPSIVETDPNTGIEGALSEFDATLASSFFAEKNDFAANNLFQLQGADTFLQDFGVFQVELAKRAATGTEFALRKNIEYDANNSPANLFPSAWTANIEAEFRHPLLQGSGVAFNRIAGPNGTPKNFNGVVLARLNTDMSQLDFEIAIRDLINNVENAYWDLYFAYRHLDSRIRARDAALETLKKIEAREGLQSGDDVLLELAREQYWEFEEEVINARSGRVVDGTRSNNGSHAGTFSGTVGLQVAERRLRLLMGWPINDDREIIPERDPAMAEVAFDWSHTLQEAQNRRAEIRKQELKLKRQGLELAATRNFLLQRVDLVGLYRFRGFGQRLLGTDGESQNFDNAVQDMLTGDFQEWRVGIESAFPIGFRQAHSAVRSAQLRYSREQAILDELTRDVIHNLSNEYANTRRAYKTMQINFNRRFAAQKRVQILLDREKNFGVNFREVLSAHRRAADADSRFFRSLVEYVVAIKNVHFEKGSLLRYNNIYLAEQSPSEQFESRATLPSSDESYRFYRYDEMRNDEIRNQPIESVPSESQDGGAPNLQSPELLSPDANQNAPIDDLPKATGSRTNNYSLLPRSAMPQFANPKSANSNSQSSPAQRGIPASAEGTGSPDSLSNPKGARIPAFGQPQRVQQPAQQNSVPASKELPGYKDLPKNNPQQSPSPFGGSAFGRPSTSESPSRGLLPTSFDNDQRSLDPKPSSTPGSAFDETFSVTIDPG